MNSLRICILGGSGFVGGHLCARLARDRHTLLVPVRDIRTARALSVLPATRIVTADVHDVDTLETLVHDCDAVINLVGIINESGRDGSGFTHVHTELARKIVTACKQTGVRRLLQMSALRADAKEGPSHYLKSKGAAEKLIREGSDSIDWTIFRPSVMFGPGDSFVNRFARLLRLAPILPLARPNARFAPVYVDDVAEAMTRTLTDANSFGKIYQLCGPKVYSLRELVQYVRRTINAPGTTVGLPGGLSRLQARILERMPGKPFSMDNYHSLGVNSICETNGFAELNIQPQSLESVVPGYLAATDRNAVLSRYRREAGRT